MNSNPFDTFTLSTLLVLAVIVPLIGVWDFQRLLRWVAAGQADARIRSYKWTLIMEWALAFGLAGWWILAGRGLAPLGLVPLASGWQWLAIGLGVGATIFMIWQMVTVIGNSEKLEQARKEIGDLGEMSPQSARELRLFSALAVTAGVCEEILYRGVLLGALAPLTGTWQAIILSSVIFGLGHAYQGMAGVAKTALVGLTMALLTVFSGSLFVAILLHIVIDLTSGRIMAAAQEKETGANLECPSAST
jgi:CAAX protease family protein